jgi:DNA polymerase III subunit gamma/tau
MSETARPAAYRVLARSWRPQKLSELIGQEALVRTLTNAIATGRVAHAFLMTGIRGTGKTTTARILARALNCEGPDGKGGPTPEPCGVCPNCIAIAEDRHIDVLEMDAATRTGIDDIREIVESVRYAPASARTKVYIVDEVHMLSEKAFNGLLKTLEEPPPHVVFVFATTEIRKIPLTVLSRCQRFDLRRVEAPVLAAHLERIAKAEGIDADGEALGLIARAAGGSVRDGLSLLDRAIALAEGAIDAALVRDMLGLADRARLIDLFDALMRGDARGALDGLRALYDLGADPEAALQELLELSHLLSREKVAPGSAAGGLLAGPEAARCKDMAERLSLPVLARAWQMLLRGLEDLRLAPDSLAAAEMVLLRLACASDLPPPAELARLLALGRLPSPAPSSAQPPAPAAPQREPAPLQEGPRDLAGAVALLAKGGHPSTAAWLEQGTHLVAFEPGRIELRLQDGVPGDLPMQVSRALSALTGRRWLVAVSDRPGTATLAEQETARQMERLERARADPRLKCVLDSFPGATIVEVRPRRDEAS